MEAFSLYFMILILELYGMSPSHSSQFASQLNFYPFGIRQHSLLVLTVSLYTLFLLSPSHPSSLPYTDMHTFHRYFIAPSSLSSLLKIWRFLKLWVHSFMLSFSLSQALLCTSSLALLRMSINNHFVMHWSFTSEFIHLETNCLLVKKHFIDLFYVFEVGISCVYLGLHVFSCRTGLYRHN